MTASTPCPLCGGSEHGWRTENTEPTPTRGPNHPDAPTWARTPDTQETR